MNRQAILEASVQDQMKSDTPDLSVGDTLKVHRRIIEGDKERVQVFEGVLIGRKGRGINETITVRRIVANEGVELVVPINSPRLAKVEVVRHADARRAKLYYLRERSGKSRRLRDQRRGLGAAATPESQAEAAPATA